MSNVLKIADIIEISEDTIKKTLEMVTEEAIAWKIETKEIIEMINQIDFAKIAGNFNIFWNF